MLAYPAGPVEAALRQQIDTDKDTGLDYSTCFRIEGGTPIHIRSLFRPSHTHFPSHTPWPSDETTSGHLGDHESFDFNTAKSVAKSARLNSGVWSLPSMLVPELSHVPNMLQESSKKQCAVSCNSIQKPRSRHTSGDGAGGIEGDHTTNDASIHGTSLTCCTACPPIQRDGIALEWLRRASYTGAVPRHMNDTSKSSSSGFTQNLKATDVLVDSVPSVSISERHSSLPGPPLRLTGPKSSLKLKARPPSFETLASKNAAYRHALLKSSMIAGQSVDIGLPVQPVLVKSPDILLHPNTTGVYNDAIAGHHHDHPQVTSIEALSNLLDFPQDTGESVNRKYQRPSIQTTDTSKISSSYLPEDKLTAGIPVHSATKAITDREVLHTTEGLSQSSEDSTRFSPEPLFEAALMAEEYLKRSIPLGTDSSTEREVEIDGIGGCAGRVFSDASTTKLVVSSEVVPDPDPSSENLSPQNQCEMRNSVQEGTKISKKSKSEGRKIVPRKHFSPQVPFRYKTVPPRLSSLERSTSISRNCFENMPNRDNFPSQLMSKGGGRVQLVSSKTPSVISSSTAQQSLTLENEIDEKKLVESYDSDIRSRLLRELFYCNEPYTARLTEIPPRKHRLPKIISERPASQTGAMILAEKQLKESNLRVSQTFTRTIDDLENLMSEALQIARQVTERQNTGKEQGIIQDLITQHNVIKKHTYNRGSFGPVFRSRVPNMLSYQESVHESAFTASSDSLSRYSDLSNDECEGRCYPTPCAFACPSDGNVVVMKPTDLPQSQSHWSSSQTSILQVQPVPVGLKSIAAGLFKKTADTRSPEVENILKNSSKIYAPNGLPNISDGKERLPTCIQMGSDSESSHEKRNTYGHANTVKPRRTKLNGMRHTIRQPYEEDVPNRIKSKRPPRAVLNKREVTEFIRVFHQPPIQSRHSSLALRKMVNTDDTQVITASAVDLTRKVSSIEVVSLRSNKRSSYQTLSSSQANMSEVDLRTPPEFRNHAGPVTTEPSNRMYELEDFNGGEERLPKRHISGRLLQERFKHLKHDKFSHLNLRHRSHISLRDHKGFSLSRSHRRQPIARDWSPGRKRFAATVACISTALIGILIGIYAGEVPSIQYYIADLYHYAILGNVCFFISLAVTTFLFWPLPLLHGRKPYILSALTIAMPLLFPQAIAVGIQRSPYVATWRVALILPRTLMGAALGFANINFMATLTDLFGASLQSSNPHQEVVDEFDVRRHGGGLGVWLGIWTWCYIGSIGVGFLIGAVVINTLSPDWGFYISIVIIAAVLLLNVVTPEVRRAPYRRSVAEVRNGNDISRRLARGEVMMHRLQTGPKWWGEEFHQGIMLSLNMLRQPGFLVMSLYVSWMYGQIVLVIVLLGSLMSKYYHFASPAVGATTMAIPLGALLAVPFQKASLFSRARRRPQRTDSMTFDKKVTFSSHLVRRAIFTIVLPFAGLAYTLSSAGPPTPFILPVLFSGLIGFLSNLAIAECNGILMETFDTSDLQPGMTGRPRGSSGERTKHKRTNYSSFPRVSSAFAIIQALGFLIGAAATGVGGVAERHIGQQAATGVMAGILLVLTVGVLGILYRFKEVQIIPTHNETDMATWEKERKMSFLRQEESVRHGVAEYPAPELEEPWRPVIIGNPSGKTRRMSILELGHLSRWSEIRRKNKLINGMSYEARHPNLATLEDVRREIRDKNLGSLRRGASQRSRRSQLSQGSEEPYAESENMGERTKST